MASFEPQDRTYSAWTFTDFDVDYNAFDPVQIKAGHTIVRILLSAPQNIGKQVHCGILVYNGKTYMTRRKNAL